MITQAMDTSAKFASAEEAVLRAISRAQRWVAVEAGISALVHIEHMRRQHEAEMRHLSGADCAAQGIGDALPDWAKEMYARSKP